MGKLRLRETDVVCLQTLAGSYSTDRSGLVTQGWQDLRQLLRNVCSKETLKTHNFNLAIVAKSWPLNTMLMLQIPSVFGKHGHMTFFLPFLLDILFPAHMFLCSGVFPDRSKRFLTNNFNILCFSVAGSNNPAGLQGHSGD